MRGGDRHAVIVDTGTARRIECEIRRNRIGAWLVDIARPILARQPRRRGSSRGAGSGNQHAGMRGHTVAAIATGGLPVNGAGGGDVVLPRMSSMRPLLRRACHLVICFSAGAMLVRRAARRPVSRGNRHSVVVDAGSARQIGSQIRRDRVGTGLIHVACRVLTAGDGPRGRCLHAGSVSMRRSSEHRRADGDLMRPIGPRMRPDPTGRCVRSCVSGHSACVRLYGQRSWCCPRVRRRVCATTLLPAGRCATG